MLLTEFSQLILGDINDIAKKDGSYVRDQKRLVELENVCSIKKLKKIVEESITSDQVATLDALTPFVHFLQDRWKNIKNTDAIYAHNPYSSINRICIRLAERLSQVCGGKKLHYLIPTLNDSFVINESTFPQHIMSDDNRTMINVLACLDAVRYDTNLVLKHTNPIGNETEALTDNEKDRVTSYSFKAMRYYKEILAQPFHKSKNELEKARNNLKKMFGNGKIYATYGVTGWDRLKEQLYSNLNTQEDLVNTLMQYPGTHWNHFLDNLTVEQEEQLLLQKNTLNAAIKNNANYTGDDAHDRALLFLFTDLYRKKLTLRSRDYNSIFGWISGEAYSKPKKESVSRNHLQFLSSDIPLSEFRSYIHTHDAAANGVLGTITKQLTVISAPEFNPRGSFWRAVWK